MEDPWRRATCKGTIKRAFKISGIYSVKWRFDKLFNSNIEKLQYVLESPSTQSDIYKIDNNVIALPILVSLVNGTVSSNTSTLSNSLLLFNSSSRSSDNVISNQMELAEGNSNICLTRNEILIDISKLREVIFTEIKTNFELLSSKKKEKVYL